MKIKFMILILAVAVILCFVVALNIRTFRVSEYVEYRVTRGDTLWEIASGYCPDGMDKREYISRVSRINNIGSYIYPGEVLLLPVYEEHTLIK